MRCSLETGQGRPVPRHRVEGEDVSVPCTEQLVCSPWQRPKTNPTGGLGDLPGGG